MVRLLRQGCHGALELGPSPVRTGGRARFHRLNSVCHKPYSRNGEGTQQDRLSHILPRSQIEGPDLALIVGVWGRLADEIKQRRA
ncbi:MAG: hypothetical protein ACXU95_13950, partial [Isosphaeraceae bacterium]